MEVNLDNLIIRNATINDIKQIATIKVNGWKSAYLDIIDNSYLESMSINEQVDKYTNSYSLKNVFVAVLNNEVVGFCRVYDYDKSEFEDKKIDCEIREIYIRPDIKRMGIGSILFNYVLDYFRNRNKKKLYLGVFESNYKSRKFYEKMGGTLWKAGYLEINEIKYPTVSYLYEL